MNVPWLDLLLKILAVSGVVVAALSYRNQTKFKKGEWLKSLYEKFYENNSYKEVRRWLENKEVDQKINSEDNIATDDDEKFTDFLNFFEFIANLEEENQIKLRDVKNLFDYYLKLLKLSPVSMEWIQKYGFEQLDLLLKKIK